MWQDFDDGLTQNGDSSEGMNTVKLIFYFLRKMKNRLIMSFFIIVRKYFMVANKKGLENCPLCVLHPMKEEK